MSESTAGRRATGVYVPSPSERVRDQVARYEATGGADGGTLGGLPVVVLTTRGARTGAVRKSPIMRLVDGDAWVAVASFAGSRTDPAWYRNLVAHPDALVQDGPVVTPVRAVEVTGTEKRRLWELADATNPVYATYRAVSGRDIPVLRLVPAVDEEE